jgi:glucan endo-1,3-alpha-glucosidase
MNGFDFSGLENGSDCWCDHSLNLDPNEEPLSREVAQQECAVPCSGDLNQHCGGEGKMRIFGRNGILDRYGFGSTRLDSVWYPASLLQSLTSPNDLGEQGLLSSDTQEENTSVSSSQQHTDKKVIAHHMVGNVYPYKLDTWISDMNLAKSAGIDGFALNLGQGGANSWQRARIGDAFTAAGTVGGFSLIFSFDMTYVQSNDDTWCDINEVFSSF